MKTYNYTSSKFNFVFNNFLLWGGGGIIILPIAFKHNIIAQNTKPDPDKPVDGGCKTCPPGPCDIWALTQTIDWSQPSKTTTGLPIELGNYDENTVSASQVFSPYETISNKKIIIEGYFTIDIPITFNNCEIIINPSISITVGTGVNMNVSFKDCYIHGTSNLWQSFKIVNETVVTAEDSYVQDGYLAFHINSGGKLYTKDTKFNKNLVSILLENQMPANKSPQFVLEQSHFNCTGNLLPLGQQAEGFFPFPPDKMSYAAIYGIDSEISVTHSQCEFSSIGNHSNGILSFGGNVHSRNILFYDIQRKESNQYPYEGNGIAIDLNKVNDSDYAGRFLNTNGWQGTNDKDIKDPNFIDVDYPLTLVAGYLNARFHNIKNSITAINGTRINRLEIISNRFNDHSNKGIYWWNSPWSVAEAEISYNSFRGKNTATDVYSSMNRGYIDREVVPYFAHNIHNNEFRGRGDGILSQQDYIARISRNTFHGYQNLNSIALHVSGAFKINTFKNNFTSSGNPIGIGIQYTTSTESLIRCNKVNRARTGYNWNGTSHLQIYENDVSRSLLGWHYEKTASTDPQIKTRNRWFPIFPDEDVKVLHEDKASTSAVLNSIIMVGADTPPGPWHPGKPVPAVPPTIVAEYWTYDTLQNCSLDTLYPQMLTMADSLIAIGENLSAFYPDGYQFKQELDLYSKIKNNNLSFPSNSVYQDFINACENNYISEFHEAIEAYNQAFIMTSSHRESINTLVNQVYAHQSEVSTYDSLYYSDIISLHLLLQKRDSLFILIQQKMTALDNLWDTYHSNKETSLLNAFNKFQNISIGNYAVENYNYVASEYQRAYSISVRYHLNQLNQNDHTTIFSFDGACLNEYHDAALIYQALSDALGQKNELQVCTSLVKPRENILTEKFKIFPNPVSDILTLEFKESFTGFISIYDINGNQVHNEFVKELSQSKISVQSLPAGNYIIHTEDHKPLKFIKQ